MTFARRVEPMLAETLRVDKIPAYVANDEYYVEQKVDGIRMMVRVTESEIDAYKRSGTSVSLPQPIVTSLTQLAQPGVEFVIDGEYLTWERNYYVFDVPVISGVVGLDTPYEARRQALDELFKLWSPAGNIRLLPVYRELEDKHTAVKRFLENHCEGIMLKHRAAPYATGKRSRHVLKGKFVKRLEAVVTEVGIDGKDNVAFAVFNGQQLVHIGKASTIGKPACAVGDVIELEYLYSVDPHAPRLVQPTLVRVRDDKKPEECLVTQLEFTDKSVLL